MAKFGKMNYKKKIITACRARSGEKCLNGHVTAFKATCSDECLHDIGFLLNADHNIRTPCHCRLLAFYQLLVMASL